MEMKFDIKEVPDKFGKWLDTYKIPIGILAGSMAVAGVLVVIKADRAKKKKSKPQKEGIVHKVAFSPKLEKLPTAEVYNYLKPKYDWSALQAKRFHWGWKSVSLVLLLFFLFDRVGDIK